MSRSFRDHIRSFRRHLFRIPKRFLRHGKKKNNVAEASSSPNNQPVAETLDNAAETPAEASDSSTANPVKEASSSSQEQPVEEVSGSSTEQPIAQASEKEEQAPAEALDSSTKQPLTEALGSSKQPPGADASESSAEQAPANESENFAPNPDPMETDDPATDPGAAPEVPHSDVGDSAEARQRAASKLQDELFAALIEQRPGAQCFYIPEDGKGRIITRATIQEQCRVGVDSRYVENVHNLGRNLFAILGYIGKATEICAFFDEGLTDVDLPFVYQPSKGILTRQNGAEIRSSRGWQSSTCFAFVRDQWHILSPIFSDKEHYKFHDNIILPFTREESLSKGAYSEVFEVTIHRAHHNWHQGPVQSPLSVAVKKLHVANEEDFEKERTILVAIEAKQNNHLVKLLFSYEYKKNYHLVFLRAKGNLRDYWELNAQPQFVPDTVLWSLRQMIGITQGLRIIHNFQVTIPLKVTEMEMETPQGKAKMSVSSGEERFGRHGDLKPENILWFQDSTGDVCQITDFGLGRFHGRDTRTKAAPYTIYSSPTYEPPECHIYLPVSRAYDLWSLGCLFLEWVSWMLNGWQAIDDFSRSRLEQSLIMNQEGIISDDYFWSLVIEGNNRDARVRNGVEQWVLNLRAHPRCSKLIHDLLNLLMNDVLCIKPKERSDAAMLHENLRSLLRRAERDSEYALNPSPSVNTAPRNVAPGPAQQTSNGQAQPPSFRHDPYNILPRR